MPSTGSGCFVPGPWATGAEDRRDGVKWSQEDGTTLLQLPTAESYRNRCPEGHRVLQGWEGSRLLMASGGMQLVSGGLQGGGV